LRSTRISPDEGDIELTDGRNWMPPKMDALLLLMQTGKARGFESRAISIKKDVVWARIAAAAPMLDPGNYPSGVFTKISDTSFSTTKSGTMPNARRLFASNMRHLLSRRHAPILWPMNCSRTQGWRCMTKTSSQSPDAAFIDRLRSLWIRRNRPVQVLEMLVLLPTAAPALFAYAFPRI